MYLQTKNESECCGCGACSEICPQNCIKMEQDKYGYVYPIIDKSKCINCNLCQKVCPFNNKPIKEDRIEKHIIYALKQRNEEDIMKAASGGAFGAIVNTLREKDTVYVWGAAFDKDLQLKHICSHNDVDIEPIHKSKYLQSNMDGVYKEIKDQLVNGNEVLFSGTPCQVAALYNYLGNKIDHSNLFTIDLVCHGVPNQKMFNDYIAETEKKLKKKILKFNFRHKIIKGNQWNTRNVSFITEDKKIIVQDKFKNYYLGAYHHYLINRDSCYKCVYANPTRNGDITIADFWGIQRFYKELDVNHGVSLIKINSNKGLSLLKQLKENNDVYEVDSNRYLNITKGAMIQPTEMNPKRSFFLDYYLKYNFSKAFTKTIPIRKEKIKSFIYSFKLINSLKNFLKKNK